MLISVVAFGSRGGSPAASAAVAIVAGVVALVAVALLRLRRLSVRDVNWEIEEWMLRRPQLAITLTAIATALFFWSLTRDLRGIPAGALAGVFTGWIGLRRSRERHGLAASASTDEDGTSTEARLDNWRLRHPALSIVLFAVACVTVLSLLGSRLIAVPVEVVAGLLIGWTSLRHSRVRHGLAQPRVPPPDAG
jgi:hypothetical protein